MDLKPGDKLGPYEIVSLIGRGGMGEVWKGHDSRLHRDVAIKTSLAGFDNRFRREAQTVAALNHPNICTLYDVGPDYLVMEYIAGNALSARMMAGQIPLDEAVGIARQIAEALRAAHEKNIVHRDLKPANIKIRPDGSVKVLDFGLARTIESSPASGADSTTIRLDATMGGAILGTAGYMSPEQARGRAVDKRTDIWAFGVVLFEMLTNQRLFDGPTLSDSLAAVLKAEPDLSKAPAVTRRLLAGCLEKDPVKRLQDIGDWRLLLEEQGTAEVVKSDGRLPWVAAAIVVLAAAGMAGLYFGRTAPSAPELRTDVVTPATADPYSFAISPDGMKIAFIATADGPSRLWIRPLDAVNPRALTGTEEARYPFWSPDGKSVGFFSEGKLKRVTIDGEGIPQTLADVGGINIIGGAWSRDDVILFGRGAGETFLHIKAGGGAETPVKLHDTGGHRNPRFLPDGKRFLYFSVGGVEPGIYLGALDGTAPHRLTSGDSSAEYLAPGWLLWVQQGALVARRFDTQRAALQGEAITLARPVGLEPFSMAGAFSAAATGALAYRMGTASRRSLAWFNRSGEAKGTMGNLEEATLFYPELSPDGERVALTRGGTGQADLWQVEQSRATRFTFNSADDRFGVWSPDGARIVFASNRSGTYNLYVKGANGAGSDELLLDSKDGKRPDSWSSDGKNLLYWSVANGGDLMVLPMQGERKPLPFVSSPANEQQGQFSPDGKWVAYQSNESGRDEIYVRPFPGPGGQWQISMAGGISPRWKRNGKEIYFLAPDRTLMAAPVSVRGDSLAPGPPEALFRLNIAAAGARPQYDVAADGLFLINAEQTDHTAAPITLLQNWKAGGK